MCDDTEGDAWHLAGHAQAACELIEQTDESSQPAPVSADPCEWSDGQILDFLGVALRNVDLSGEVKLSEIRQGFEYVRDNACLDKVKELNH